MTANSGPGDSPEGLSRVLILLCVSIPSFMINLDSNIVAALVAELDTAKAHYEREGQPLLFDMLTEATRSPAMGEIVREHSRAIWTLLAEVLRKGQAKGQVDPSLDPALTAAVLVSIIDGSKILAIRDSKVDLIEARKLLKVLITRFLTPPHSPDSA